MTIVIVENKYFVDTETGEIVPPPYDIVDSKANAKEKRYYAASSVSPSQATDKGEITDFISATVDKRKLKTLDIVDDYKKESDFSLITLKEGSFMTNPQYAVLSKLKELVVYQNIILEEKKTLATLLGVSITNLNSKLKTVKDWVKVSTDGVKKGFIKVEMNPNMVFKAEYGKQHSLQEKALQRFHNSDKETKYNALYVPFVGPLQPYSEPEWSQGSLTYFSNLKDVLKDRWEKKLASGEDSEQTDIVFSVED